MIKETGVNGLDVKGYGSPVIIELNSYPLVGAEHSRDRVGIL